MNNCSNCGSSLNQGEAFCKVCGAKMPMPQTNFFNNTQQPQDNNYQTNEIPQNNFANNNNLSNLHIENNTNKSKTKLVVGVIILALVVAIALGAVLRHVNNTKKNNSYKSFMNIRDHGSGVIGNLDITIPSVLQLEENYSNEYIDYATNSNYSNKYYCSLHLSIISDLVYKEANEAVESSLNYYKTKDGYLCSEISQKNLNGNKWNYASVTWNHYAVNDYYFYSIKKDNVIYTVNFYMDTSDDDGTCLSAYNTIINSLRFK